MNLYRTLVLAWSDIRLAWRKPLPIIFVLILGFMLYGISAGGEDGARHALKILRSEIDRVLALTGICSIDELTPDLLWHPDFMPVKKF